jgi:hypothetical protein
MLHSAASKCLFTGVMSLTRDRHRIQLLAQLRANGHIGDKIVRGLRWSASPRKDRLPRHSGRYYFPEEQSWASENDV